MGVLTNRRPRIKQLRRRHDVEGLWKALGYRDEVRTTDGTVVDLGRSVRREAMAALRGIDDDRVIPAAREALEDEDPEVGLEAARALKERGAADEVVDALARSPERLTEEVRIELRAAVLEPGAPAVGALFAEQIIRYGDQATRPDDEPAFLVELLSRHSASDRELAAWDAVAELGADDEGRAERAFVVLSCLGDDGVQALREALDRPHRAHAARALGRLRDSSALPDLIDLLGDADAPARAAAAQALGDIRDPRAVEGLLQASTDDEFVVREACIEAVDKLGSAAVVFAMAAFVQPLLSGPAAGQITATSFPSPGAEDLPSHSDAPAAISSGSLPGTVDRLRAAARRARARRQGL
jgi:HEAT repeat protein